MSDHRLEIYKDLISILTGPMFLAPYYNKDVGFAAEVLMGRLIEAVSRDIRKERDDKACSE